MYTVDKVYIWQNQVGEYAFLNGTETTVTSTGYHDLDESGNLCFVWDTSTDLPEDKFGPDWYMQAMAGDLRPKDTPSGEQSILDMFKMPELEPA